MNVYRIFYVDMTKAFSSLDSRMKNVSPDPKNFEVIKTPKGTIVSV